MCSSLKDTQSLDSCNVQSRPIKYMLSLIVPCLLHMYNLVLMLGQFPVGMQRARVAVIYKKDDKNVPGNYRPISVLPFLSKGFERLIHRRLYSFLLKYSVMVDCQYGFARNRSTERALLDQKEYILKNFGSELLTLGILVDFSKAFDCLNHEMLLKKLKHYGVRGHALKLITSYVSSRSQYVVLNHCPSENLKIRNGVPQGSLLGPLLFNVYINDICNISKAVKYIIYADDTSIFLSSRNIVELTSEANRVLT